MLHKTALTEIVPLSVISGNGKEDKVGMIRTASGRVIIEPNSDKAKIVEAEIAKHPNSLFFRAKAIEANKPNSNGDYFSEEELLKAYKSFEGVPFFTNHDNQNIENARGKIIFAEWIPEEKACYTIAFVDRDAYPHICRSIEEEYVTGVSMGSMRGDAMISMADGSRKKIKDIKVGEFVFSPFGNKCSVLKTHSENLHKPMYKIVSDYSNENCYSDDHPIYVYRNNIAEFIEAKKITKNDKILIPLLYNGFDFYKKNALDANGLLIKDNGQIFLTADVKEVKEIEFDENSYDLTVENDESYIADGIAVHNCSVEFSVCNICGNKAEKTDDYCFVPGTPVLMEDLSVKNIEDVKVGDVVIDAFGNETKVTKTFIHDVDENILSIKSKKICNELKVTKNHPFLAERRGEFHFIPAEYLDDKETLFTPITKPNGENFFETYRYEDEESKNAICKLLGYFIAEGHLIHNSNKEDIGINISLHSDEKEYLEEIVQISEKIFNKSPEIIDRNNYNHKCKDVRIYDQLLVSMIYDSCSGKANQKILNKKIINLDNKYIKQILAGYIDGDGYSDEYGRLIITTASRNLAYQLIHLLARIGITASIGSYLQNKGPNNRDELTTIYRVSIGTMQTVHLDGCGIKASKSAIKGNLKISDGSQTKLKNSFDHDGFIKSSAYGIEELSYQGSVYNIETESHSYVADNISVHNCTHIRNRKGRKFTGRARNVTTGEVKDFKDEQVFEYNYGLKFIELSAVVDPACPSCHIQGIIPNSDYLKRVANMENTLRMIKTAAMEKNASKEEIEQMEGVLSTMEEFAVNLIKKRKQVEPTFAGELVEIMTKLQEWLDELVGAGYGNVKDEVPGTVGDENSSEAAPEAAPAQTAVPEVPQLPPSTATGVVGAVPAAAETPIGNAGSAGSVGKVSGAPGKAPVASPKLPITAPLKPRATDSRSIQRISDVIVENGKEVMLRAANLISKMEKTGDIDMGKRRTINERIGQREMAKEVLSSSWKEKQDFIEYIKEVPSLQDNENKLSVKKRDDSFIIVAERKTPDSSEDNMVWTHEDLTAEQKIMIKESPKKAAAMMLEAFSKHLINQKEGVKKMTEINKNAGATTVNPVPDQVTEAQLAQKGLYHSRTEQDTNQVTQAQLESKRKGEKDVVTESQLNESIRLNPRTGVEADQIQEAQLKSLRENRDIDVITQSQLEGNRVNNEQDVVTESQLKNTPAPWARSAKINSIVFKSAKEHLDSAIEVMANSVISAGCTPDEVCEVAASLVDTTKNRMDLSTSILDANKSVEEIDFAKRAAYWNNTNLKVASTDKKQIAKLIVDGLRVVASDNSINPDVLINAIDVIGEGEDATVAIAQKVEKKLQESAKVAKAAVSIKSEMREALKGKKSTKEVRDEERSAILASIDEGSMKRESERQEWEKKILNKKAIKNADTVIETDFSEVGCKKSDPSFRKSIVAFTKGALASQNLKMAAITNVTISGDTIQIAVQTDEGADSVEIPVGDMSAPAPEETVPEGDMAGEGLENAMPPATDAATATAPAPAGMEGMATASAKRTVKTAQSPMGGGVPGTPGGVAAPGAPEQGLPGSTPGGDAVQALTTDDPEGGNDVPTVGEQQMPWTICPECGSSDVDVTNDSGDIKGKCNNSECGAEYEAMMKKTVEFKIVKPSKAMSGEGTAETPEAPEAAPEVPALPVAAQTRIDKGTIVRIGNNKSKYGHVCPACGKTACKATTETDGQTLFTCPSCKTDVKKEVLISASNPEVAFLRVNWDLRAKAGCKGCDEKVAKFASKIKVEKLLRSAAAEGDKFPMGNCVERIARTYGGNTVGSFGPCKGKVLAECVCKELKRLALTKVRHLTKLAEVSMQKDPMDECLEAQAKKGYQIKEAKSICNCLKKKFASEISENIYAQAFAEDVMEGKEKSLTAQDLITLHEMSKEAEAETIKAKASVEIDEEIGSDLPALKEAEIEVELVKDAPKTASVKENKRPVKEVKEAKGFFCDKCKKPTKSCDCPKDGGDGDKDKKEDKEEKEDEGSEKEALAMNGQRIRKTTEEVFQMANTKTAGAPKFVEHIEQNVEAGVPRSEAYMGSEKAADSLINKTPGKPNVPRSEAYMGKEKEADSLINKPLKGPDVAVDSSYMGHEKEVQKNMPAINNDIKGTVIADSVELTIKDGKIEKIAKQMKEIDTVEKNVDAGVPRSDAKMGEESKADSLINKKNKGPDVPRSEAYMGGEKDADSLINKPLKGPDVPIDSSYMGSEKEVQKGMPAINDEMLKQVRQQREDQLSKIAAAREKKANQVAAWLAANRRIASDMETFESTVKALSAFEIDKIITVAEKLFPERNVKTASSASKVVEAGHSLPAIVMESKQASEKDGLAHKLSSAFTIGNSKFDQDLTIYGEKSK